MPSSQPAQTNAFRPNHAVAGSSTPKNAAAAPVVTVALDQPLRDKQGLRGHLFTPKARPTPTPAPDAPAGQK